MKTGEIIDLHLLEYDSANDSNHIKDLGEVTFDEKGIAKAKFTTNEIKTELGKLWNERKKYELFFAAEYKEEGIQFADFSRKNRAGKDTVYPATTVSHKGLEKAKFTYIDSKKDITSVRFLKSNGKDAFEVMKYGETIKLKVQTRNLEGTKLKLTLLRNKFGNGIDKFPQTTQVTVKDEKAEWTINTTELKKKIKQADWTKVGFWQVELEESDGDKVKYPDQNARLKDDSIDWTKLMTYQSLKLSDNATISELAQTNAPLVVGVPMEAITNSTGIVVCECEARVRAFLRMIRIGEGTEDEGGYTRIVGGSSFADHGKDMSDHPKVYISKHDSTAAGAYQITKTNWNDAAFKKWREDNKITDFSKVSQDIYGVYLTIIKKGAFNEIKNKDLKGAVDKCKKEWASLPGAGYGQREEKFETIQNKYDEFLKEELAKKNNLTYKKRFP